MTRRSVEILVAVVLFVSVSPVIAVIEFKDGLTHDIDYQINADVRVDHESPGLETTLNILDGTTMSIGYRLEAFEDSNIRMFGGSVNSLHTRDSSQATVSGGTMGNLHARNSSQVTVSGGTIDLLFPSDSSQVTVSGGTVGQLEASGSGQVTVSGGTTLRLMAWATSQVTVSGGTIDNWLSARDSSQVTVSGGSMDNLRAWESGQVTVSGGTMGGELLADFEGILTIHGWDFAVDGTPVGYTELYSIFGGGYGDEPNRQLTGTLLSGDPINNQFRIGQNGMIVLTPEPATLFLLGLGAVMVRKKR